MAYRLQRWGATTVIVPPNQQSTNEDSGLLVVDLKNARRKVTTANCDTEGIVALRWHGKGVEIKVRSESYIAERSDTELSGGAGSGMYLDPLQDIAAFHSRLLVLQAKGCFSSAEVVGIKRAVSEKFPLPPSIAYRYQLGSYDTTGFFELTPDFRLQVVSPIYDGNFQTVEHQTGYEVSYYRFKPASADKRLTASLTSVAEFRPEQPSAAKTAPRNRVDFPTSPSFFHLLFKTDKTLRRQITRAFLLSSTDASILERGTNELQATSASTCEAVSNSGVGCIEFPATFGVSPELQVRVNGKKVFVRLDGLVLDTLGLTNSSAVPKNLRVTRLFAGKRIPIQFDRANEDILSLILMPGDEITW